MCQEANNRPAASNDRSGEAEEEPRHVACPDDMDLSDEAEATREGSAKTSGDKPKTTPPGASSTPGNSPDGEPEPPPEITTESVVEAILLATDAPLPAPRIAQILGVGDARSVKKHIAALNARYERTGATFRIEQLAGGFQILTLPAYNTWVSKLHSVRRETKLSPAALETLAVVAYKQPALRADIEAVRGVAVGDVLNRLREMGLVKIVGRAEVIGRPMLYGTTRKFLQVFGLASLDDLPKVDALALQPQQEPAAEPEADRPPQQKPEA